MSIERGSESPLNKAFQSEEWDLLGGFTTRNQAMIELANALAEQVALLSPPNQALHILLTQFSGFAYDYFKFFAEEASLENTNAYILQKRALESLQSEWENIGRACMQYLSAPTIGVLQKQLIQANANAQRYYNRFGGYKPVAAPAAYFERIFAITRYPFITPAALVSIPIQFIRSAGWQALAHELGHHIFWNSSPLHDIDEARRSSTGALDYRALHRLLRNNIWNALVSAPTQSYADFKDAERFAKPWLNWLEETFADICGTLMAGIDYARSAQQLAEEYVRADRQKNTQDLDAFAYDTGIHPIPYLRPQIALETLEWALKHATDQEGAARLRVQINALRTQWENTRRAADTQRFPATGQTLIALSTQVNDVVNAILSSKWVNLVDGKITRVNEFGTLFALEPRYLLYEADPPVDANAQAQTVTVTESFAQFRAQWEQEARAQLNIMREVRLRAHEQALVDMLLRDLMLDALSRRSPYINCVPPQV